jgi:hypothetical protein
MLALAGALCPLGGPATGREGRQLREAPTTLGTLTCTLSEAGNTLPTAQARDVLCRFRPGGSAGEETYAGTLQSVGQAEALFGSGTVMLEVKGPAHLSIAPGLLQQSYAAEPSMVSVAPPLIGETNDAIMLQPVPKEEGRVAAGKTRPEAAILVVELRLKSTPA